VRGEGAHLVDADGVRFMTGQHELAELAPRDVVAKAIMRRAREQGTDHMYLDARHFGATMWEQRFPTILAACRAHGIDPVTEPVPVAPAAHYASGGVRTDLHGRTTVPGLYACGETACTGVHGANRLASNSLLEGLVFAERIAACVAERAPASPLAPLPPAAPRLPLLPPAARTAIQQIMTEGAGVLRSAAGLARAVERLDALGAAAAEAQGRGKPAEPGVEAWETTNLHLVAKVLATAALRRTETRGCHWREDHPDRDDTAWRRHQIVSLGSPTDLVVRLTDDTGLPSVTKENP
ncbi:MAG TPA: FAD-binding protein, partial [Streptomyces sp.]|nr:FAD-binding protein [Streptomyces sp.]